MKERLSPKKEPPTTIATMRGSVEPVCSAMPTATGVSATTVPTEVPIESEMKQAARKSPGSSMLSGSRRSVRVTVASMAPMAPAALANAPASTNAQQAVKNAGLDLSEHVSKQISEEDIKTSDVIFTMTNAHKQMLMNVCAKYGKPIFSLAEFAGSTEEISDPYGGSLEVYENCFRQIAGYVNMAAEIIKE